MSDVIPTMSMRYPVRPLPRNVPYGVLRIVVWHTFTENGATGSVYVGPVGNDLDEWESLSGPNTHQRVRMTEARWEYDGINITRYTTTSLLRTVNDVDEDLRDLARAAERIAEARGWTAGHRWPTPQEIVDGRVIVANNGWNEVTS